MQKEQKHSYLMIIGSNAWLSDHDCSQYVTINAGLPDGLMVFECEECETHIGGFAGQFGLLKRSAPTFKHWKKRPQRQIHQKPKLKKRKKRNIHSKKGEEIN